MPVPMAGSEEGCWVALGVSLSGISFVGAPPAVPASFPVPQGMASPLGCTFSDGVVLHKSFSKNITENWRLAYEFDVRVSDSEASRPSRELCFAVTKGVEVDFCIRGDFRACPSICAVPFRAINASGHFFQLYKFLIGALAYITQPSCTCAV
jgi:hypothetical protein